MQDAPREGGVTGGNKVKIGLSERVILQRVRRCREGGGGRFRRELEMFLEVGHVFT